MVWLSSISSTHFVLSSISAVTVSEQSVNSPAHFGRKPLPCAPDSQLCTPTFLFLKNVFKATTSIDAKKLNICIPAVGKSSQIDVTTITQFYEKCQ